MTIASTTNIRHYHINYAEGTYKDLTEIRKNTDEALGELKEELKEIDKIPFKQWYMQNKDHEEFDSYPIRLYTLLNHKARNLVNALEAEGRKITKEDNKIF